MASGTVALDDLCWIAVKVIWLHASKLLLEDEDTRARVNAKHSAELPSQHVDYAYSPCFVGPQALICTHNFPDAVAEMLASAVVLH